jgi:hypothetical protein
MNKQRPSGILLWTLFIGPLFLTACKKEVNTLPPATQRGLNTYGCLLNKKAWIPTGSGDPFSASFYPTGGGFFKNPDGSLNIFIEAWLDREEIEFFLKHTTTPGIYKINKTTYTGPSLMYAESYGQFSISYAFGSTEYFVTDSIHTGSVTITRADTTLGIVSGTFDMQLFQSSSGRIVNITKGRFDFTTH